MDFDKKPWECEDEIEKMISLNQYSEDFDALTKTIRLESLMNVRAGALLLALRLKPMDGGQLRDYLSNDVGLLADEAIELLDYAENVAHQL